ncbi:MAG: ABC transporter substrate-binding protein [Natronomonas sp.]
MGSSDAVSRRSVLGGVSAAATIPIAGCFGEVRTIAGRESTEQLELRVATLPADVDPYSARITTALVENLTEVGIDAQPDPLEPEELLRRVLINHDFDIYVGRYPGDGDPETLWSLLRSSYGEESGWQNPFGFSDLALDDLLETQRRSDGTDRQTAVEEIQDVVVREQPFTTVCFADRISIVRTDQFQGWDRKGLSDPLSYLTLESDSATELRVATQDHRITQNWNPIAAEHRNEGVVIGLLYEPLCRILDDELVPWLAREVTWDHEDGLTATVLLRDASFHDGRPVTAEDVTFSYRFLRDTSLGRMETPVPTSWRRGRVSLVEDVEAFGTSGVEFSFGTDNPSVARRAFTTPILPESEWIDRTYGADVAGIDLAGRTTEALIQPNDDPIGSGPFRFVESEPRSHLRLERFDEHFLREDATGIPPQYAGGPSVEAIEFLAVPSSEAVVQTITDGEAAADGNGLHADVIQQTGGTRELDRRIGEQSVFYHLGYNCRRQPLSDARFRRAVARLIDREHLVETAFGGYARPAERPIPEPWSENGWDGMGSLPFAGIDGDLTTERARDLFREAGYQYDDGELVVRSESR